MLHKSNHYDSWLSQENQLIIDLCENYANFLKKSRKLNPADSENEETHFNSELTALVQHGTDLDFRFRDYIHPSIYKYLSNLNGCLGDNE